MSAPAMGDEIRSWPVLVLMAVIVTTALVTREYGPAIVILLWWILAALRYLAIQLHALTKLLNDHASDTP